MHGGMATSCTASETGGALPRQPQAESGQRAHTLEKNAAIIVDVGLASNFPCRYAAVMLLLPTPRSPHMITCAAVHIVTTGPGPGSGGTRTLIGFGPVVVGAPTRGASTPPPPFLLDPHDPIQASGALWLLVDSRARK